MLITLLQFIITGKIKNVWKTRHKREEIANSPHRLLPCLALTCMLSAWVASYLTDGTLCVKHSQCNPRKHAVDPSYSYKSGVLDEI